ncbi:MAG TPA: SAM hydrolase/SAM-dependent halogenase family protein [Candidatus Wunengus sp. YC61]|uniref:SAM hydrolase/SAM-dependent halogenase family protein n=1 Tax=Candidatus Wunengus sp. YC61 TaxID=3367698 RepID=UPI00402995AC
MTVYRPRIITLLTDFGNQDAYVGIMKGIIAGINPFANIVDICHSVPPQDIFGGAYLLYSSYKYFPKKTIHVAVVDPGVGSRRDIVCVETKDYFFLAPDNGLLSFIIQNEKPKGIFRITNNKYFLTSPSNTFHGRDVFAPVAAHLSLGVKPQQLGNKINQLEQLDIPKPVHRKTGQVEGQIIYIDQFGNLITNITKEHVAHLERNHRLKSRLGSGIGWKRQEVGSQTPYKLRKTTKNKMLLSCNIIETTIGKKKIVGLSKTYTDVKAGEPLVLFGSAGFLEVSINQGNAQKYFRVDRGNKIRVEMGSY